MSVKYVSVLIDPALSRRVQTMYAIRHKIPKIQPSDHIRRGYSKSSRWAGCLHPSISSVNFPGNSAFQRSASIMRFTSMWYLNLHDIERERVSMMSKIAIRGALLLARSPLECYTKKGLLSISEWRCHFTLTA